MPRRVLHDRFFKQAKAEGYLARSAYKLKEIQESKRILRSGDRVLDLGCAPGAWLQVAAEIVGPTGRVVGIDLQTVAHQFPPQPPVTTIVGDLYKTPAATLLEPINILPPGPAPEPGVLPRRLFDCVVSDMAPSTNGINDHEMSIRLCDHVVSMLPALLRPGGSFAIKVFEGGEYPRFLKDIARLFASSKGFKPKSSREVSREMYVVATGYRAVL
ncbi:MAG: RlmE family RNA methyltransferase [Phycisphaerales bacterium]|nr:RlmE family RNA methyltransferase [Phycisphaerales bacterium]